VLGACVCAWAKEPRFVRHAINPDSQYCACAAIDVNGDGRLDIVCGAFWYEAPEWKRHKMREIEMIRGRYDDYSNLAVDVNGDGRLDVITANYRSQTLRWAENIGPGPKLWPERIIAKPGAMETGRLYDIDGDGQLDVLPNGMKFAAWWEFVRVRRGDGTVGVRWVRHDLPQELAGHGVGFGDINGDGRGDVVGPKGWAEAPPDRRTGTWQWHAEFDLQDASIPILVFDVDGDGANDIVWGRGHNYGLFWLRQVRDAKTGARRWEKRVIDMEISQAHSILLADVDGDGADELVAGKRYMGHGGRDPGEKEPLQISWYEYDRAAGTWRKHVIDYGSRAGFGLDPKAVDIDGDGDIDLLAADLSGLYLLENLLND